jgi:hypothetical protein
MNVLSLILAATIVFHGSYEDCSKGEFGGHIPPGFVCHGTGTGVGMCTNPRERRSIVYDIQLEYCHLDWVK